MPYLLGWRRGRWWRQRLLERRRTTVDEMLAVLKTPGDTDFETELTSFQAELRAEYDDLAEHDQVLQRAMTWDQIASPDGLPPNEQLLVVAYQDVRDIDPRVEQVGFLDELWGHAEAIKEELSAVKRKDYRRKKAESHIGFFEDERAKIDSKIRSEGSSRNWVLAASSVIVLPIMGGVLSKVGERVWEIIDTAPQ